MGELHLRLNENSSDDRVTHPPIGRLLLDNGKIEQQDLLHALSLQTHVDAPLGDILVADLKAPDSRRDRRREQFEDAQRPQQAAGTDD